MSDMPKVDKTYNLAFALGGGGARGIAHIGVLKVLEREGVIPDLIVGTSMGAIIGGMYAQLLDAAAVEEKVLNFVDKFIQQQRWTSLLNTQEESKKSLLSELSGYVQRKYIGFKALTNISLESKDSLYEPLTEILIDNAIEECKMPFASVALDLVSGETRVLRRGSIIDAIYASSAIEGIFPPLEYNGGLLGDGGPVSITPVEVARGLDSRFVVASDVHHRLKKIDKFANGLEVMLRADNLGLNRLRQIELSYADAVISPRVGAIHWASFNKARECIRRGEQAAEMMIPVIKKTLKQRNFFSQLKKGFKLLLKDLSEGDYR